MLSKERICQLAGKEDKDSYTISLFLDIDPQKYPSRKDIKPHLKSLLNEGEHKIKSLDEDNKLNHKQKISLQRDINRIEEFVSHDLNRNGTKSISVFADNINNLWEIEALPESVNSKIVINHGPYVRPLLKVLTDWKHFGFVIISKDKTRLFRVFIEKVVEHSEIFDEVPGRHEQGGWSQARFSRHIDDHVGRHLSHTFEALEKFYKIKPFDYLVISTTNELKPIIEKHLRTYLLQKMISWEHLPIDANIEEIINRFNVIRNRVDRLEQDRLYSEILRRGPSDSHLMYGVKVVIDAFSQNRIKNLVIQRGFIKPGKKCLKCNIIYTDSDHNIAEKNNRCKVCDDELILVDDAVEEIIEKAFFNDIDVRLMDKEYDLTGFENIVALL